MLLRILVPAEEFDYALVVAHLRIVVHPGVDIAGLGRLAFDRVG